MTNPYHDHAVDLIEKLKARLVVLIVLDGSDGTGVEALTAEPNLALEVPTLLRSVANQMERGK